MSNNRNNNRRRGRGNNRSQGGGQLNRIDSRARGNAPQLLEKYKKLAQDASLNGDRVQAEYYLQFADHYFRVIAATRALKEETRPPRREFDRAEDEDDFEDDFDRGQQRPSRNRRDEQQGDEAEADEAASSGEAADDEGSEYEPAENPFIRDSRSKPRRGRRERTDDRGEDRRENRAEVAEASDEGNGLDPSTLPPAIAREEEVVAEPAPRRTRRPRTRKSDDDETLEAVN